MRSAVCMEYDFTVFLIDIRTDYKWFILMAGSNELRNDFRTLFFTSFFLYSLLNVLPNRELVVAINLQIRRRRLEQQLTKKLT